MQLIRVQNYSALSHWAADQLLEAIRESPSLLLCPATGSTPLLCYQLLAQKAQTDSSLFDQLRLIALDEIVAPAPAFESTCLAYLKKELLHPLKVSKDRFQGFDPAGEPEKEVDRMNRFLKSREQIDLCLLGLGINGHLGFVEPADQLSAHAHVVQLHASSQQHQMFREMPEAPTQGLTLGIGDLLRARRIVLLVNGARKKEAVRQLLTQQVSTRFPASLLWLHPNASCTVDEAALP